MLAELSHSLSFNLGALKLRIQAKSVTLLLVLKSPHFSFHPSQWPAHLLVQHSQLERTSKHANYVNRSTIFQPNFEPVHPLKGHTKFTTSGAHDVIAIAFVPKSFEIEHNLLSHWIRSVYHLAKLDLVVYYLGRERGLWSLLWHKLSPWEAVLVLDFTVCNKMPLRYNRSTNYFTSHLAYYSLVC